MIRRLLAILILWLPFSLAAMASVPVLLWALGTDTESAWRPIGRAQDCLLAALLGFSGRNTLSAELGAGKSPQWLRKILDMIQSGHCEGAAKKEGLL